MKAHTYLLVININRCISNNFLFICLHLQYDCGVCACVCSYMCVTWQVGGYLFLIWKKFKCLSFALSFLQLEQKSFTAITWNKHNKKKRKNNKRVLYLNSKSAHFSKHLSSDYQQCTAIVHGIQANTERKREI